MHPQGLELWGKVWILHPFRPVVNPLEVQDHASCAVSISLRDNAVFFLLFHGLSDHALHGSLLGKSYSTVCPIVRYDLLVESQRFGVTRFYREVQEVVSNTVSYECKCAAESPPGHLSSREDRTPLLYLGECGELTLVQ
jgi:hypothetical protein